MTAIGCPSRFTLTGGAYARVTRTELRRTPSARPEIIGMYDVCVVVGDMGGAVAVDTVPRFNG